MVWRGLWRGLVQSAADGPPILGMSESDRHFAVHQPITVAKFLLLLECAHPLFCQGELPSSFLATYSSVKRHDCHWQLLLHGRNIHLAIFHFGAPNHLVSISHAFSCSGELLPCSARWTGSHGGVFQLIASCLLLPVNQPNIRNQDPNPGCVYRSI